MVEALRHFELATAAGHAEAQFNLAVMIEAGGVATEAGAKQQTTADLARVRALLSIAFRRLIDSRRCNLSPSPFAIRQLSTVN